MYKQAAQSFQCCAEIVQCPHTREKWVDAQQRVKEYIQYIIILKKTSLAYSGPRKTWTKSGLFCVCLCPTKWVGPECGYAADSLGKRGFPWKLIAEEEDKRAFPWKLIPDGKRNFPWKLMGANGKRAFPWKIMGDYKEE